jgi:hypothetical protein
VRLYVDLKRVTDIEPRAGDVIIVGDGNPPVGDHITVCCGFDAKTSTVSTISGNGVGLGPDGKRREGIVRRDFKPGEGYQPLWLVRPAFDDLQSGAGLERLRAGHILPHQQLPLALRHGRPVDHLVRDALPRDPMRDSVRLKPSRQPSEVPAQAVEAVGHSSFMHWQRSSSFPQARHVPSASISMRSKRSKSVMVCHQLSRMVNTRSAASAKSAPVQL